MDGKILGIPLVLIVLVLFIALLVDIPLILLHSVTQQQLNRVEIRQLNQSQQIIRVQQTLVEPTATPSAMPTPVKAVIRQVTKSASSTSATQAK